MKRSLVGVIQSVLLLAAQAVSASVNSAIVNLATVGAHALQFDIVVGAFAFDGTNYLTIKMTESDDGTNFTDVAVEHMLGEEVGKAVGVVKVCDAAGDASKLYSAGYLGYKQYVRIELVETGTVTTFATVNAIYGSKDLKP